MQQFSLKISKSNIIGEAYWRRNGKLLPKRKQRTTIFIAKIAQYALKEGIIEDYNALKAFVVFLEDLLDTELHEHYHIFFANIKKHPSSERQTKFFVKESFELIAEILAKGYAECYMDVFLWLDNELKKQKFMKEIEQNNSEGIN